ncbi:MAG: endo-1,4-beta-xylanase [Isosphaeraceae bacterium]
MSAPTPLVASLVTLLASLSSDSADGAPPDSQPPALREVFAGKFDVGVGTGAVRPSEAALVTRQFSGITPENSLKMAHLQPTEGTFNFGEADEMAGFTASNGMKLYGHTLVWARDDRTPAWFLDDGGKPATKELLLARLRKHIETVAGRYRGKVASWDVVNEAIADEDEKYLRPSGWSDRAGEEFIALAFEAAHRADPEAVLIYNDYGVEQPKKRAKLLRLLRALKEKHVPVHAVGIQGHWEIDRVPFADIEATINALRDMGLKVMITELDLDVIPRGGWWADGGKKRDELAKLNPYAPACPPEVLARQAEQYAGLFRLFVKHADVIERVGFWNLHDGKSWLNYFPWRRTNHPLLFDREMRPKPAFWKVVEVR